MLHCTKSIKIRYYPMLWYARIRHIYGQYTGKSVSHTWRILFSDILVYGQQRIRKKSPKPDTHLRRIQKKGCIWSPTVPTLDLSAYWSHLWCIMFTDSWPWMSAGYLLIFHLCKCGHPMVDVVVLFINCEILHVGIHVKVLTILNYFIF